MQALTAELQQWEGLHQQRLEEAGDGEEEEGDDLFSEVSRRLSSFASGDNVTEEVGEAEAAKEEGAATATAAAEDEEGAEEEDDIFSFRRLSTFFDGTGEEAKGGEADEAKRSEQRLAAARELVGSAIGAAVERAVSRRQQMQGSGAASGDEETEETETGEDGIFRQLSTFFGGMVEADTEGSTAVEPLVAAAAETAQRSSRQIGGFERAPRRERLVNRLRRLLRRTDYPR